MANPNNTEQTVELVITGQLTLPAGSQLDLSGKAIASITLVGATIEGYSAQVGGETGPRPSQRTPDHVKVRITCTDVTLVEDEG